MKTPTIELKGVTKHFAGGQIIAVNDVSMEIATGEFFALLGPSGCGKTTLLRMLAGFEIPSKGEILINGQSMSGIPPNRRPVNMVFQSYAIFPHMTVQENIAYGLRVTGVNKQETQRRVKQSIELVRLSGLEKRMPENLSGGQRQRIALARALVKQPKVLLLDEPLSALDANLREEMQIELAKLQKAIGITFVIVTHDQNEALSMADRVAVMRQGKVCQLASPSELYETPSNRFVANFIGKMNIFEGVIGEGSSRKSNQIDLGELGKIEIETSAEDVYEGKILLAVRPEKIMMGKQPPENQESNVSLGPVKVVNVVYLGDQSHITITSKSGLHCVITIQNSSRNQQQPELNQIAWIYWDRKDMVILRD